MSDAADRFPMSKRGKVIVGGGTVTAAALALAVGLISSHEGEVRRTYVDRLGRGEPLTYCYGETAGAVAGRTYTHAECLEALRTSAMAHAQDVARCLPPKLPDATAAAFYDMGYNLGAPLFCRSAIYRAPTAKIPHPTQGLAWKANHGDLAGACAAISLFTYSAGKDCRIAANRCSGIVKRRAAERELCDEGLHP